MKNFNRDGGSGDRRGGGFSRRDSGGRSFGGGGRSSGGRPEMHRAVCAECGQSCEVPFKPTGDKPVYCSNCFSGKENSAPRRSNDREFSKPMFGGGDRKLFKVVCDKCGKDCEVPFEPSPDKPVYCNECFGKGDGSNKRGGGNNDSSGKQFEALNAKLDKILSILAPNHTIKLTSKKEETKKEDPRKENKNEIKKEIKLTEVKVAMGKEKKEVKKLKKLVTPKTKVLKKAKKKK